ncbi:MAG: hypothetical protein FJ246_07695, partial [Nitrospira sp.]|nr:hypothetical protein [Nitrospira sp.]
MPAASPSPSYWDQLLKPLTESLRDGGRPCLTGAHGATAAFGLTVLARTLPSRSWLIVAASDEEAERLY